MIDKAKHQHIDAMKALADANRSELGFILRAQIQDAIEQNRAFIACIENRLVGFVIYRHRKKDLQTTLAEICISKEHRKQGLGKELINALILESSALSRSHIQLKCPVGLPANQFYEKLGFSCVSTQPGKSRNLNIWIFELHKGA